MPDGQVVRFPDGMPPDQIRQMIEATFPDAANRAATPRASLASVAGASANVADNGMPGPGANDRQIMDRIRGPAGFGDQLVDSFTFGLSKDAAAGGRVAGGWLRSLFTGEDVPDFQEERAYEQRRLDAYRQQHPVASAAADVTGAVAGGALYRAPLAATLPGRAMQAARVGAGYGGAAAFGNAEGSISDRAAAVPGGAVTGAALGAVATPVTEGALNALAYPFNRTRLTPAQAQRMADAQSFDIPLTRGQTTGNLAQTAKEEAMRHGGRGGSASSIMQGFDRSQAEAVADAGRRIGGDLGAGTGAAIPDSQVAGEMAGTGVQRAAQGLKASGTAAYRQAESIGASFPRSVIDAAPQDTARRLASENFRFDQRLHPTAFAALGEVEQLAQGSSANVDFGAVHDTLKVLNSMKGTNAADAAALSKVRRAFMGWWGDAVDNSLYAASDDALAAIKRGNRDYSAYLGMVRPKAGDDAGAVIKRMVAGNTTGQEVANWLYGASVVNPPARATRVAARLKGVLGASSEEWSAVRQGAWLRALGDGTERGPKATAKAVRSMLDGPGRSLSAVLYTDAERELMRRFAGVLESIVPDARATNPPKTAYAASRAFRGIATALSGALGFHLGGPAGAVASFAAAPAVQAGMAASSARWAINPKLASPLFTNGHFARLTGRTTGIATSRGAPAIAPAMQSSLAGLAAK
jgi:hypothetical protein